MNDTMAKQRLDALPAGSELHGHRLESVLGAGSFGITYLAWHKGLNTRTVIKEFMPENAMREGESTVRPRGEKDREFFEWGLSRFFDEARLLYSLSHPSVVKVTDVFEANGTAYFVMPYLEGSTLHDWLKSNPRPGRKQLQSICIPLLEGLKYIHGKGILHRDIKPENIYILSNGHPTLIDFGAARQAIGTKSKSLTQVFTPHFAPFEQYSSTGSRSPALDLYSLGACMYYAITGELPLEAPARIEEDKQPRLADSDLAGRYGRGFLAAVDMSLAVRPKDRFQSGMEFQKALLAEEADGKISEPPPSPPDDPVISSTQEPERKDPPKPASKKVWKIFTCATVLVLALAGAYFAWRSGSGYAPASAIQEVVLPALQKEHTNSIGMEFVLIPSGSFMMGSKEGSDDERPQHRVTISKPFYLGKYPVTQEQWRAVMGNNPSKFKNRGNHPVESVSWDDAQDFIRRLNAKEGHNRYRLPTEAEWEYAARAGTSSAYSFGDDKNELSSYGQYDDKKNNSVETTYPVGQKKPNPWGLYDVHGNVYEWVQDWYGKEYYANSPDTDPKGPSSGSYRVIRGGSWGNYAEYCRSASRDSTMPVNRSGYVGFRLALSLESETAVEANKKTVLGSPPTTSDRDSQTAAKPPAAPTADQKTSPSSVVSQAPAQKVHSENGRKEATPSYTDFVPLGIAASIDKTTILQWCDEGYTAALSPKTGKEKTAIYETLFKKGNIIAGLSLESRSEGELKKKYTQHNINNKVVPNLEKYIQASRRVEFYLATVYDNGLAGYGRDAGKAFQLYSSAAKKGDIAAQYNLAIMYRDGKSVQQNDVEAARLFALGAKQGIAAAEYNLAWMYKNGRGVEKSDTEALHWFLRAARQGFAPSQHLVGFYYSHGIGVPQNYAEAYNWYNLAVKQDNFNACVNLGWMYEHGHGVNVDYKKAVDLYKKAAIDGKVTDGINNLARMYDTGRGVALSYSRAMELYLQAAEAGHSLAKANIGYMYEKGRGVKQDYATAVKWYRESAEEGDKLGQNNLGSMYYHGFGVKEDLDEAVKWYRLSAAQGLEMAVNNLEKLRREGVLR